MDSKQTMPIITENELQEMRAVFKNEDFVEAARSIRQSLVDIEDVILNIAVTGESGSGKSTFINVIRGVEDEDKDAAKTGVVETTVEPTPYSHPQHKNVHYWDLPGIGTPSFNARDYMKLVNFSQYDFFFIIASERFKDCHIQLAQAIHTMGKKFYFLRSKIDSDLNASRTRRRNSYNEENILKDIRNRCIQGLHEGGIKQPQVFLLSCLELDKYDFYNMQKTLESELPSQKRHVFLLSLPNIYKQALEKKKDALRNQIWKWASGYAISSLCARGDIATLVNTMTEFKEAFGLDERSLEKLAKTFGKELSDLKSVIRSPLVHQQMICEHDINRELLSQDKAAIILMLKKYVASLVPVIASMADVGIAFGTAYWMLCSFLTDVADDAARVLSKALESSA
ncbi:interferon-inducible GTPase 5-like [Pseudophryne corroboree]|uniref:interferon-inducible GTPase 5-like n=1 Tax=Pseudophryne corroboree TaxID=495146 RepID=UPI003081E4E5